MNAKKDLNLNPSLKEVIVLKFFNEEKEIKNYDKRV
jgi:hypothetical protein